MELFRVNRLNLRPPSPTMNRGPVRGLPGWTLAKWLAKAKRSEAW
jgi:hypothetical protein